MAVDRPTAKQGRGVDQFESGGTHHHFRARRHSPTNPEVSHGVGEPPRPRSEGRSLFHARVR
jgi:hypothetical protein